MLKKTSFKFTEFEQFELFAVLITAVLKFLVMDWLNQRTVFIAAICTFWLIYILIRISSDKNILKYWGFKKQHFKESALFLVPSVGLCLLGSSLYGYLWNNQTYSLYMLPVFILYPLWGTIQQFLMLGIISKGLRNLLPKKSNKYIVTFIVSFIFSLIHYPSLFLMGAAFFMEVLFISVYFKWRNLWSIGIAHGWMALFLIHFILKRDLWAELFR